MINQIKELRVRIDGLAKLTRELHPFKYYGVIGQAARGGVNSGEINAAVDDLLLAKAWLGKMLGELGTASPYANDGNRKTKEDIEPTADVAKSYTWRNVASGRMELGKPSVELNHIEKVDWLRKEIKNIIDTTEDFSKEYDYIELEQGFVYKHLSEARFWLGFELSRYKDINE